MPANPLEAIEIWANQRDGPCQSLIEMTLADQFQQHPAVPDRIHPPGKVGGSKYSNLDPDLH